MKRNIDRGDLIDIDRDFVSHDFGEPRLAGRDLILPGIEGDKRVETGGAGDRVLAYPGGGVEENNLRSRNQSAIGVADRAANAAASGLSEG